MSEFTASPHFLYGGMQCEKISLDAAPGNPVPGGVGAVPVCAVSGLCPFGVHGAYHPGRQCDFRNPDLRGIGTGRCGHLPPREKDAGETHRSGGGGQSLLG